MVPSHCVAISGLIPSHCVAISGLIPSHCMAVSGLIPSHCVAISGLIPSHCVAISGLFPSPPVPISVLFHCFRGIAEIPPIRPSGNRIRCTVAEGRLHWLNMSAALMSACKSGLRRRSHLKVTAFRSMQRVLFPNREIGSY